MPTSYDDTDYGKTKRAIEEISRAWRRGQMIVPIVGAGLSADSGVPVIQSVVRYLAKFRAYLQHRAYLPEPTPSFVNEDLLHRRAEDYFRRPLTYLEDHGWPDRFQINEDLWNLILHCDVHQPSRVNPREGFIAESVDAEVRDQLDDVLRELKPTQLQRLRDIPRQIVDCAPTQLLESSDADDEHHLVARLLIARGKFQQRPDADQILQNALSDAETATSDRSVYWNIMGEWTSLLQYMTGHDGNYADALFSRFNADRSPSLGHRFLAFLAKLMGLRLILTFNFDPLIEVAFALEKIAYTMFAMEEGKDLPHPFLLRETLAIVKMHGATHSLLLDERLNHPLSDAYKRHFDEATPDDPLLVILGCSGADARLRDLVRHVAARNCRSVWLHFEREPPIFLETQNLSRSVWTARVQNPGLFLAHLYRHLTGRHPASLEPYDALAQRPIGFQLQSSGPIGGSTDSELGFTRFPQDSERASEPHDFVVFVSKELIPGGDLDAQSGDAAAGSSGSLAGPSPANAGLVQWVNSKLTTHTPIWIDLEAHYTLAGVVGSIIDQCRRYDPGLAPAVLPIQPPEEAVDDRTMRIAVMRVRQALSRARYVLALDGYDSFCWQYTVHHGLTSEGVDVAIPRLDNIKRFLLKLLDDDRQIDGATRASAGDRATGKATKSRLRGSLIGISVDPPKPRYHPTSSPDERIDRLRKELRNHALEFIEFAAPREPLPACENIAPAAEPDNTDELFVAPEGIPEEAVFYVKARSDDQRLLTLVCLCCFRRTRTSVALRQILGPLWTDKPEEPLGDSARIDAILEELRRGGYLIPVEGGGFWMNRPLRDKIYSFNSRFTSRDLMDRICSSPEKHHTQAARAACQALVLASHHDRIARYYYSANYVLSKDTGAFFEYVYHRVSSIRYLTRLSIYLAAIQTRGSQTLAQAENPWHWAKQLHVEKGYLDDEPGDEIAPDLAESIGNRRIREIRSLRHTWLRTQAELRGHAPAEQVIGWCRWLDENDLRRFVVSFYLNPSSGGTLKVDRALSTHFEQDTRQALEQEVGRESDDLSRLLRDIIVKSCFERSDFQSCIRERVKQLDAYESREKKKDHTNEMRQRLLDPRQPEKALDSKLQEWVDRSLPDLSKNTKVREAQDARIQCWFTRIHYWIDVAASVQRIEAPHDPALAQPVPAGDPEKMFPVSYTLFNILGARLGELSEDVESRERERLNDALLRHRYRMGDLRIWMPSFWHPDENFFQNWNSAKTETMNIADEGLRIVRQQDPQTAAELWDPLVGHPKDGSLYKNYRTLFHILQGRASWLGGEAKDFDEAYRCFELARGGVDVEDRLLMALPELAGAEACLVHADLVLTGKYETGLDDQGRFRRASIKYSMASGLLKRARNHLLAGRRNVVWWRYFWQLCAQYHAECCLLKVAEFKSAVATVNVAGGKPYRRAATSLEAAGIARLVGRLQRGLDAIRQGIDYSLRQDDVPIEWIVRVWFELLLAGTTLAYLTIRAWGTLWIFGEIWAHWLWLNRCAGLIENGGGVCSRLSAVQDLVRCSPENVFRVAQIRLEPILREIKESPHQPELQRVGGGLAKLLEARDLGTLEELDPCDLRRQLVKAAQVLSVAFGQTTENQAEAGS